MSRPLRIGEFFRHSRAPLRILVVTRREKYNYESDCAAAATVFTAAVAAAANSGWRPLEDLEPRTVPEELVQVVLGFEDGFDYYVKFPAGTNIHGVNKQREWAYINAERSHHLAPNDDYEYWCIEKWYPSINAVNNTPYADTPKVFAQGYRYLFRDATRDEGALVRAHKVPCRYILMGGVASEEGS